VFGGAYCPPNTFIPPFKRISYEIAILDEPIAASCAASGSPALSGISYIEFSRTARLGLELDRDRRDRRVVLGVLFGQRPLRPLGYYKRCKPLACAFEMLP
jgi:hypothetical protein